MNKYRNTPQDIHTRIYKFVINGSITKKDFIAKCAIVKKETKETHYWLSFIRDTKLLPNDDVEPYIKECQEILFIISKIILNTLD